MKNSTIPLLLGKLPDLYTLFVAFACLCGATPAEASIRYVKTGGNDSNTGLNWTQAYLTIQKAIEASAAGDEIWVQAGTYKPTKDHLGDSNPANARRKTFYLKDGVALYGGFAGTETARSQRNWSTHVTTLSGDIGTSGNDADNCYHVVLSFENPAITILDGFTITKGNADGSGVFSISSYQIYDDHGAGMQLAGSSATINNCLFFDNNADSAGGGIFLSSSSSTLTDCVFSSNQATFTGAGGYSIASDFTLNSCSFLNNQSFFGAGLSCDQATVTANDCIFQGNISEDSGGGLYFNNDTEATINGCSFISNVAGYIGGGLTANSGVSCMATNCIFSGNTAAENGGGIALTSTVIGATFANCLFTGNHAVNAGGGVLSMPEIG